MIPAIREFLYDKAAFVNLMRLAVGTLAVLGPEFTDTKFGWWAGKLALIAAIAIRSEKKASQEKE